MQLPSKEDAKLEAEALVSSAKAEQDANGVDSSTTKEKQVDAKPEESFEDQALVEFEKTRPAKSDKEEETESSTVVEQSAEANAKAGTDGAKAKDGVVPKSDNTDLGKSTEKTEIDKKAKVVNDEQLPFHKHERFQELLEKEKEATEAYEQAKPLIERQTKLQEFLAGNNISEQQFIDALQTTALINTNPQEARKKLDPLIKHLDGFTGASLPKDLADKVEAGKLELADAKEIASLRTQKTFVEQRGQQTQAQTHQQQVFTALNGWEQNIQAKDADYGRKTQQVNSRYVSLVAEFNMQQRRNPSPQEHVQLAQKAYDEVQSFISGFVPQPKPTKNLSTNGAHATAKTEPKSWEEVEDFLISRYK